MELTIVVEVLGSRRDLSQGLDVLFEVADGGFG